MAAAMVTATPLETQPTAAPAAPRRRARPPPSSADGGSWSPACSSP